jgi:hypothetical protein
LVAILFTAKAFEIIASYIQESLFFVPWSESIDGSRRVVGVVRVIKIDMGRNGSIWLRGLVRGIHGKGSLLRMSSDKGSTLGVGFGSMEKKGHERADLAWP